MNLMFGAEVIAIDRSYSRSFAPDSVSIISYR